MNNVNKQSQIVEVPISDQVRKICEAKAQDQGVLNNRTIVKGEGKASGIAGEFIVGKYLSSNLVEYREGDRNYDFISRNRGIKIDVKTKSNSVMPRPDYDCTIPMYQNVQECDVYVFTRTSKDMTRGWINGWITKENFYKVAQVRRAGDSFNNNGRPTVKDHYVVRISDLRPIEELKDYL